MSPGETRRISDSSAGSSSSSAGSYQSGELAAAAGLGKLSNPSDTTRCKRRSCAARIFAGLVHGFVDQATFSLLFFKLHKLSITLPIRSSTFWYYAPTCLLSDIIVVATLQVCAVWLCSTSNNSPRKAFPSEVDSSSSASSPLATAESSDDSQETQRLLVKDEESGYASEKWASEAEEEHTSSHQIGKLERLWSAFAMPSPIFVFVGQIFLALISFVCVFVTFASVSSYLTQHAIFSWKLAYDNLGSAGVLKEVFEEHWFTFLVLATALFGGGLCITATRLLAKCALRSAFAKQFSRVLMYFSGLTFLVYLVYCAAIRPPIKALQATDLLLDGFAFGFSLMFGPAAAASLFDASNLSNHTSIYGYSNVEQPRLSPINAVEHVFLIYLESGESLAWPYSPEFCQTRNCSDIAPEYDTPDYFTPFFNSLVTQDPEAVLFEDFRTNLAFTTKSHLATECGTMPEVKDGVTNEAMMKTLLPCLPDAVKAFDPKFRTRKFIAQGIDTDNFGEAGYRTGWESFFSREDMEKAWGETRELSNWWGYSDEEIAPFVWDWIDERLNSSERIFMAWSGATMHLPFALPPFRQPVKYTEGSEAANGYLNTVKYTDEQLRLFFEGLKERNILDKSLVVIQGDHGPRIAPEGWVGIWGWFERTYRSPLLIRAPGLVASQFEQDPSKALVSIDILPTILDAIGVDPKAISQYSGQSALRVRGPESVRDTYHSSIPGNQFPHVQRYTRNQHLKARRSSDGDTCTSDIKRDPTEQFSYCLQSGWEPRTFTSSTGTSKWGTAVDAGLWEEGSRDAIELQDFTKEASGLLDMHLAVNHQYWDLSNREAYAENNAIILEEIRDAAERSLTKSLLRRAIGSFVQKAKRWLA